MSKLEQQRESVIKKLYCLGRSFRQTHRHASSLHDLTIRQIQALHLIAAKPAGATITELASEGQVAAATASQLADRLTAAGWIKRVHDRIDKRLIRLKLTTQGRKHFLDAANCRLSRLNQALQKLGASDLKELDRLLTKFNEIYSITKDEKQDA